MRRPRDTAHISNANTPEKPPSQTPNPEQAADTDAAASGRHPDECAGQAADGADGQSPRSGTKSEPAPRNARQDLASPDVDLSQVKDQLLRLRADFDNFRKRTLREKALLCETANEELITELLPVLDHMQLAIQAAREHNADPAFQHGLLMIFEQLAGVLGRFGLEPIEAEGRPFDPGLHDAVNCVSSDTHPEGTIIAQARRGYLLKKRLLRPAQVVVSAGAKLDETASAAEPESRLGVE